MPSCSTGELPVSHCAVGHHVEAGVEHAEVLLPQRLALHVEGVEPFGSEERDRCRSPSVASVELAWRRLRVALDLRHAVDGGLLPLDRAGLLVERVDAPLVRGVVLHRRDVAVEPDLQARVGLAADRGRDEHLVAPDDRARQPEAGDRRSSTRRWCLSAAFHVVGSEKPSATPAAAMPRNCGQSTPGRGARGAPVRAMQVEDGRGGDDQSTAHRGYLFCCAARSFSRVPSLRGSPFVPAVCRGRSR